MINQIRGDVIKYAQYGHYDVLVHLANCQNTMGAGVAKQIREAFPAAYEVDQATHKGDYAKLGKYSTAKGILRNGSTLTVMNAYGQYKYSNDPKVDCVDYRALQSVLEHIARDFKDKHILFPQIGRGLAGGDWDRILDMICLTVGPLAASVTIVEYAPDIEYLVVAGSRNYNDADFMNTILNQYRDKYDLCVVSGEANGADTLGAAWAIENGIGVLRLPALWEVNGVQNNSAGYQRNIEMGVIGTLGAVFFNEVTKGSDHMVGVLERKGVSVRCFGHKTCPKCEHVLDFEQYGIKQNPVDWTTDPVKIKPLDYCLVCRS